jgi:predicted metal-dependent hydrolase
MIRSLAARLRKEFPQVRFRIRKVKLSGFIGRCSLADGLFTIELNSIYPDEVLAFILPHELAHALTWHEKDQHGPQFWAAYQQTYGAYERWIENDCT